MLNISMTYGKLLPMQVTSLTISERTRLLVTLGKAKTRMVAKKTLSLSAYRNASAV